MKSGNKSVRVANLTVMLVNIAGMMLSIYAYHVEVNIHSDPTFKALCDISEHMSCSKVFSSRYGTGFGIIAPLFGKDSILNQPNSVYGMVFYILQTALAFRVSYSAAVLQLVAAVTSILGCVYLAYILVFILGDLCVVCVSTYVINAIILICSIVKYRSVNSIETTKRQKNASKKAS